MPNWCNNNLIVEGSKEDVEAFRVAANGPIQTYNNLNKAGSAWPIHDDVRLKALISELPEAGETSELSFHALVPVPEEVRLWGYDSASAKRLGDAIGKTPPQCGYSWENENWGVKWGACEVSCDPGDDHVLYSFDTPWGPPIEFLITVAKKWNTLTFTLDYSEPGMAFEGEIQMSDGVTVYHNEREMEDNYEEDDE